MILFVASSTWSRHRQAGPCHATHDPDKNQQPDDQHQTFALQPRQGNKTIGPQTHRAGLLTQ